MKRINKKEIEHLVKEIEYLVTNVNPRAKPPDSMRFWPEGMVIAWLRSHQKKTKPREREREI